MNIRSKFYVEKKEMTTQSILGAPQYSVGLRPVYGNGDPNHENTKFWQYTPAGSLSYLSISKDVYDALELGKEYYIDITPAE